MSRKQSGEIFRYTLGGGQWVSKKTDVTAKKDTSPGSEFDAAVGAVRKNSVAPNEKPKAVPKPKSTPQPKSLPIPPVIPPTVEGLTRSIMLLGNAAQNNLTGPKAVELAGLLGRLPKADETAVWKQNLKQLAKECRFGN